jgi:hypothetical protein
VRFPSSHVGFCNPIGGARQPQWPARVRDISAGGVGLILGRRFEPESVLWVELPEEAAPARHYLVRVVRVHPCPGKKWLVGCAFARPLTDDEVKTLSESEL